MKNELFNTLGELIFLSDLCGREAKQKAYLFYMKFLSDLCGREENRIFSFLFDCFLSDLCGREDLLSS